MRALVEIISLRLQQESQLGSSLSCLSDLNGWPGGGRITTRVFKYLCTVRVSHARPPHFSLDLVRVFLFLFSFCSAALTTSSSESMSHCSSHRINGLEIRSFNINGKGSRNLIKLTMLVSISHRGQDVIELFIDWLIEHRPVTIVSAIACIVMFFYKRKKDVT
jgi:hypothetical protein